jgi:hypothetical protein
MNDQETHRPRKQAGSPISQKRKNGRKIFGENDKEKLIKKKREKGDSSWGYSRGFEL